MSFELFLAIRYLRTPRKNRLAQFTALCAVAGIAFGVAALIIAQAAAQGFRQAIQNKILAHTAHITVFSKDNAALFDWQNLKDRIERVRFVKSVSPTTTENVLLVGKTNSNLALLKAVPSFKFQVSSSSDSSVNQQITIEIGKDLAEKTGLQTGDTAEIVAGNASGGGAFTPTTTTVAVGAIFETGLYEYDSTWVRVSLEDAARLTGQNSTVVTALEIETNNIYETNNVAALIAETISGQGDYQVLDWQTANRPLFAALSLERQTVFLIISLIVFIAALNVTTTLALVVNERKSDIAILKVCGAKARSIIFIFLCEGALLGGASIAAGVLLGLISCFCLNYFRLITLPPDVYSVKEIVLQPFAENILLTAGAAFVLTLAASSYPAWAAARLRPLDIWRN